MANSIAFSVGGSSGGGMVVKNIYTGYEPFIEIHTKVSRYNDDYTFYQSYSNSSPDNPYLVSRTIQFPAPVNIDKSIIRFFGVYHSNDNDAPYFFKIAGLTSTSFVPVLSSLSSTRISSYVSGSNILTFGPLSSGSVADPSDYLEYGDDEGIKTQIRDKSNNEFVIYPDILNKFRWEVIEFE